MPKDDFGSKELSKLLSSSEEEIRKALRIFEQPLNPIVDALKPSAGLLGSEFEENPIPATDVLAEQSRKITEFTGTGLARDLAANLTGIGYAHRSVPDHVNSAEALLSTVTGAAAAGAMALPTDAIHRSALDQVTAIGAFPPSTTGAVAAAAMALPIDAIHRSALDQVTAIGAFPPSTTGAVAAAAMGLPTGAIHRSVLDHVTGIGASPPSVTGVAAAAMGLPTGAIYRSALDQVTGIGALIPSATGVAAAAMGLPIDSTYGLAARSAGDFVDQFRLPAMGEVSRLLQGIANPIERQYGLTSTVLESSLGAMNQPWLNAGDTLASVTGIAKLHGIGHLVASEPPFAPNVAKALRADFGDWRDPITWPSNLANDMGVRAGLYVERGFNPLLTEFPVFTFEEGLESSGLQEDIPVLVVAYGEPVPRSDDNEEETFFERNNLAHDWLQRFETQIRHFIDRVMSTAFGSDWPRHRLPNGLYDEWLSKKVKDTSGHSWPIIYYADFTDYERIICKQDNWKAVFASRFKRPELVRESLQRLYPSRLATMHARPLMPEDELFIFVEIKRLVRLFVV
jgi:hypothetical protein